jgi:hypothetical protein
MMIKQRGRRMTLPAQLALQALLAEPGTSAAALAAGVVIGG